MSAPAINSTTDAITYLVGQHQRIRELFDEVARAADTGEREHKFFELRRLLAVHETAEEEIIHPLARRQIDHGSEVVDALLREENSAKKRLAELESMDVGSAEFVAELAALRDAVLAHATHEETEEFTRLRAELGAEELRRLRSTVQLAEALAPTRPHPGVESATANVLAGPFAAMMDRAKDLISMRR